MTDKSRVISVSGLRILAEYIRDAINEAVNKRTVIVRHTSGFGWESPVLVEDGSMLISQAYEIIQNGTVLEVS